MQKSFHGRILRMLTAGYNQNCLLRCYIALKVLIFYFTYTLSDVFSNYQGKKSVQNNVQSC